VCWGGVGFSVRVKGDTVRIRVRPLCCALGGRAGGAVGQVGGTCDGKESSRKTPKEQVERALALVGTAHASYATPEQAPKKKKSNKPEQTNIPCAGARLGRGSPRIVCRSPGPSAACGSAPSTRGRLEERAPAAARRAPARRCSAARRPRRRARRSRPRRRRWPRSAARRPAVLRLGGRAARELPGRRRGRRRRGLGGRRPPAG
jgi:hypothetical protein